VMQASPILLSARGELLCKCVCRRLSWRRQRMEDVAIA
jgi:hypothetical protein